jgi:transcriptional regulator with XRE-family HTH domain
MDDTSSVIGEVIRRRRSELGISQAQLAADTGMQARQIRRYEAGEQQPSLVAGIAIAQALRIPVLDLVGQGDEHRVNLSGEWWMSWQTSNDGVPQVTAQTVQFTQQDTLIKLQTTSRGSVNSIDGRAGRTPIRVEEGGYHWSGGFELWDNRILMGWYAANDGGVQSKGTLFFVLGTHGDEARGIWTGISHDGDLLSGWGALGTSEQAVIDIVTDLKETRGAAALRTDPDRPGDQ